MKEYKIAKGWAIFIYIFAPLLIILFGTLLFMPLIPEMQNDMPAGIYWLFGPLSLGMIILMTIGLLDTINGKLIVTERSVTLISTFSRKELLHSEIRGFRSDDKYIYIEPLNKDNKRIKISAYIGKRNELERWLSDHFKDLDLVNIKDEQTEIFQNPDYGFSEDERNQKLKQAKLVTRILNWTGAIVLAWTWFMPNPYSLAIISCIILPVIAIITVKLFNGLIRIDQQKGSMYPSIFMAILFPALGVSLRGMMDFEIIDHTNIWLPATLISGILIFIIVFRGKEFTFKKVQQYLLVVVLAGFMFGYGYGTVVTLNCHFDRSEPQLFSSTVVDKRISSGKTTSYYLELIPWNGQTENQEVSVPGALYKTLEPNDQVIIYSKQGLFNIPWFIVIN